MTLQCPDLILINCLLNLGLSQFLVDEARKEEADELQGPSSITAQTWMKSQNLSGRYAIGIVGIWCTVISRL